MKPERKEAFTIRPPISIMHAVKQLAVTDSIATERAMGADCLRVGVAIRALAHPDRAGLSEEDVARILMPYAVPLTRFLQTHGLIVVPSPPPTATAVALDSASNATAVADDLAAMANAADDLDMFMA